MSEAGILILSLAGIAGFVAMIVVVHKADIEAKKIQAQQPRRGLLGWLKGDPLAPAGSAQPIPEADLDRLADRVGERLAARLDRDRALLLELAKMSEAEFAAYKAALTTAAGEVDGASDLRAPESRRKLPGLGGVLQR